MCNQREAFLYFAPGAVGCVTTQPSWGAMESADLAGLKQKKKLKTSLFIKNKGRAS